MKKYVPDCYWPASETGGVISHEAICVLNTNEVTAVVELTLYFTDRDKMEGFVVEVEPERTAHIRMDQIKNKDGEPVPRCTAYAIMVECNVDIPVQYTRVDTLQAENAMMTTMI